MTPDILHFAWDLDAHGFAGREAAVRQIARSARAAGAPPVLVAVLADPAEPDVARLRAFGRIAAHLARRPSRHDAPRPVRPAA